MAYYNPRVNRYLLDVPLESLVYRTAKEIDESGGRIEKQRLKRFLIGDVRALRLSIPPISYPELTMPQAHEIVQELLRQGYLTFSEEDSNPKTELYFESTQKAKEIRI